MLSDDEILSDSNSNSNSTSFHDDTQDKTPSRIQQNNFPYNSPSTNKFSNKNNLNIDSDDVSLKSNGIDYNLSRRASSNQLLENEQENKTRSNNNNTATNNTIRNQDDSDFNNFSENLIGEDVLLTPISIALILHPTDSQVKPIVNNRSIEPVEKFSFTKTPTFPITPLNIEGLNKLSQSKLEEFMKIVSLKYCT